MINKQNTVTTSSTEAELLVLLQTAQSLDTEFEQTASYQMQQQSDSQTDYRKFHEAVNQASSCENS